MNINSLKFDKNGFLLCKCDECGKKFSKDYDLVKSKLLHTVIAVLMLKNNLHTENAMESIFQMCEDAIETYEKSL